MIEGISALTLATRDMPRAVRFYAALRFDLIYGGGDGRFASFCAGSGHLNLTAQPDDHQWAWWGRAIFYAADVDAMHARVVAAAYQPDTAPRDALWGERYFHLTDPDGHELSFARPLSGPTGSASPQCAIRKRRDDQRKIRCKTAGVCAILRS